jgi:hypothetical protein
MSKQQTKTAVAKSAKGSTPSAAKGRRDLDAERKEIEDSIRVRATDRARKWSQLVELLDAMLDQAHALDRFGIPLDPKLVSDHAQSNGVPLSWARQSVEMSAHGELIGLLQVAHNRLATIEGYVYMSCGESWVGNLARIIEGKEAFGEPQLTIAGALKEVKSLLRTDLEASLPLVALRKPADYEEAVIYVLLHAETPLTQKAIADEIVAGRNCTKNRAANAKGVGDAMDRLRSTCGYTLKKISGRGFMLTDEEIRLSAQHGLDIPQRRQVQSE